MSTGEQHKDVTYSRVARDSKDTQEVLLYLSQTSSFKTEASLKNIATGVTVPQSVNVHKSKTIVNRILASMEGNQLPHTYSGKRPSCNYGDKFVYQDPG